MTKLLIVEDMADNAELVRRIMSARGYEVLHASDAETGLQMALAEFPDLILLDLGLSDYDGLTLAGWLRAESAFRHVPIIAYTVMHHPGFAAQAHGVSGILADVGSKALKSQLTVPLVLTATVVMQRAMWDVIASAAKQSRSSDSASLRPGESRTRLPPSLRCGGLRPIRSAPRPFGFAPTSSPGAGNRSIGAMMPPSRLRMANHNSLTASACVIQKLSRPMQ